MTGQGGIPWVHLTFSPLKDLLDNRFGIVPPELSGNTAKEFKGPYKSRQDAFKLLARQSHAKPKARMAPGGQQHRYLLPAPWKINVDVPKIGFQTLAGIVRQRNKCFTLLFSVFLDVSANLVITALVAVLIPEPPV
ncbi:hypothetical protein ES705_48154 [subsurface metagenome]